MKQLHDPTCIVCLSGLATAPADESPAAAPPPQQDAAVTVSVAAISPTLVDNVLAKADEAHLIVDNVLAKGHEPHLIVARLLPCGHHLHNACLEPWVQRANSCPICRTRFNMVEVSAYIDGPVDDSYGVQDKTQEAVYDPSVPVPDEHMEPSPALPCIMCEDSNSEDHLLLCDGCSNSCHVHCAGLQRVPDGTWFCQFCDPVREYAVRTRSRSTSSRRGGSTSRSAARRSRASTIQAGLDSDTAYAQVSNVIFSHANVDLDFPFAAETPDNPEHRREFRNWERHFRRTERQASVARLRTTVNTITPRQPSSSSVPDSSPESAAALRAWNVFDRVNRLEQAGVRTRKRNHSPTGSDEADDVNSETQLEAPRQLKRPRHRRAHASPEQPASDGPSLPGPSAGVPLIAPRPSAHAGENAPTFLQALLNEVETVPAASGHASGHARSPDASAYHTRNHSSPGSAPGSPSPASPASSRPRSPTQGVRSRPVSPPPLTSRVEPAWYFQSALSPSSPSPSMGASSATNGDLVTSNNNGRMSPSALPVRGNGGPAKREELSLAEKKEVRKFVTVHLNPLYRNQKITSGQFAEINRVVSHFLYERIIEAGGIKGEDEKWTAAAGAEVKSAFELIQLSAARTTTTTNA